ncbi:MAG: hypothetical protein ACK4RT_04585 [Erythrobacter sp.]
MLAPVSAMAQSTPPAFSGPAAAAMEQSIPTPGIDADEAAVILKALLANRKEYGAPVMPPEGMALLQQLSRATAPVPVVLDGRPRAVGPMLPDGARFMQLALGGTPDNLNLWQSTNPEIRLHLVRIHGLEVPALTNAVEAMVYADLLAAWNNSSVGNSYEPLRNRIGDAVRLFDTTTPENRKTGRALIVKVM